MGLEFLMKNNMKLTGHREPQFHGYRMKQVASSLKYSIMNNHSLILAHGEKQACDLHGVYVRANTAVENPRVRGS